MAQGELRSVRWPRFTLRDGVMFSAGAIIGVVWFLAFSNLVYESPTVLPECPAPKTVRPK